MTTDSVNNNNKENEMKPNKKELRCPKCGSQELHQIEEDVDTCQMIIFWKHRCDDDDGGCGHTFAVEANITIDWNTVQ